MKKCFLILLFCGHAIAPLAQQNDSVRVYTKCRNDISLMYFAKDYNPTKDAFSVKGARVIENKNNEQIAIVPDSAVVVVAIKKKGQQPIYLQMYSKEPPAPVFAARMNGKKYYSFNKTASGPLPASIEITPVSDDIFKDFLPFDASYRIMEWEVSLNRGNRPIKTISLKTEAGVPAVDFNTIRSAAKSGDVIQIEVRKIMRKNAVGEMIPQKLFFPKLEYTLE